MRDRFSPTRIHRLTRRLAFPRLGGSRQELTALEIVAGELRSLGLEPVLEPFPVRSYRIDGERLEILQPDLGRVPCATVGLAGRTGPEGVEAPLHWVESAYPEQLVDLAGSLALTYRIPLSVAKYRELSRAGLRGLIRIAEPWEPLVHLNVPPLWELISPPVPMVHVPFTVGERLVKRRARRARLIVDHQPVAARSHNLMVEIPGTGPGDDLLLVGAHIDSVERIDGALDNASGAAVLVELTRVLAARPPRRTIRLLWLGCEEIGCIGSYEYVRRHRDELERRGRLYLNVDVTGAWIGREEAMVVGAEPLRHHLEILSRQRGLGLRVYGFDPDNMTDIQPFCTLGLPAVALERVGGAGESIHTSVDRMARIGAPALGRTTAIALTLLRDLADGLLLPDLPRVDDEIRDRLRRIYVDRDGLGSTDEIFARSLAFRPDEEPSVDRVRPFEP